MIPPVYDIAFIGTSLTSNRVGGWQSAFKQRLQLEATIDVRCYDAGTPGGTTADMYPLSVRAAMLRPRAVVIEAGMNDAPVSQGISVAQFKTNVIAMIAQVQGLSPNSAIFLMTMNPVVAPPGSSENAARLPDYYEALRELSVSEGVGLIDVEPLWGSPTTTEIPDGVHPTLVAENAVLVPKLMATFLPLVA